MKLPLAFVPFVLKIGIVNSSATFVFFDLPAFDAEDLNAIGKK
jgi:hypothetical protein